MSEEIRLMPDGGYRVHETTRHFDNAKGCYSIWSVRDAAGTIVHSYQGDAFAETGARTLCDQLNVAWAAGRTAALPADARERVKNALFRCYGASECGDTDTIADSILTALGVSTPGALAKRGG